MPANQLEGVLGCQRIHRNERQTTPLRQLVIPQPGGRHHPHHIPGGELPHLGRRQQAWIVHVVEDEQAMAARPLSVVGILVRRCQPRQVGQHPPARQVRIRFLRRGAGVSQLRGHREFTHQGEEVGLALRGQRPRPTAVVVCERVRVCHGKLRLPEPTQTVQCRHDPHLTQGHLLMQPPHLRVTAHERRRRAAQVPGHRLGAARPSQPVPYPLPEFAQARSHIRFQQRLRTAGEPRLQIDVMMAGDLLAPASIDPTVRAFHLHEVDHRDRVAAHRDPGLHAQVLLELPPAVRRAVIARRLTHQQHAGRPQRPQDPVSPVIHAVDLRSVKEDTHRLGREPPMVRQDEIPQPSHPPVSIILPGIRDEQLVLVTHHSAPLHRRFLWVILSATRATQAG